MRILVCGADGYTGLPLVCNLVQRGHDVVGIDNLYRRELVEETGGESVTPIANPYERERAIRESFADGDYEFREVDLTDPRAVERLLANVDPDAIVNLAQIPSAPYSMLDVDAAWQTQRNNVRGALNLMWALRDLDIDTHVVQLATMGEYGTPDHPLPEGFLADGRPAPKEPGSFYHASKVQTTVNTLFAARTWDIPVTEIYQGIVYGVSMFEEYDDRLLTRFDVDDIFGTVINRFTAQAVLERPLTVYGEGGQKRAMLSLKDCIQCLTLAVENPPEGVNYPYRAINQFDEAYRINDLAALFADLTDADIQHVENPRTEDDSEHFYAPEQSAIFELGYSPTQPLQDEIIESLAVVGRYADRIPRQAIMPRVQWAG